MTQNHKLDNLISISNNIGKNTAYIQGGGGNTSYKESNILYVKASGTLLKDMSINTGIAEITLNELNKYLENPDSDENIFALKVQSFCINNKKPSIEAGLHAVIPNKYVIHSHSVYANILNCSLEARDILDNLFKDEYIFIPYATPGVDLIKKYKDILQYNSNYKAIFLQNHGLITFSDNHEKALNNHYKYSETIKTTFKLEDFEKTLFEDINITKFLFPDQVVYSLNKVDKSSIAYRDTIRAYLYIYKYIHQLSLTANFLTDDNIAAILGMDSEKYRATLNNKI